MADFETVDLRSDTLTRPDAKMRRAMAEAEVGDDVLGEDPTVLELEALSAERIGKDAALFMPSGTMGNEIALHVHSRRVGRSCAKRRATFLPMRWPGWRRCQVSCRGRWRLIAGS